MKKIILVGLSFLLLLAAGCAPRAKEEPSEPEESRYEAPAPDPSEPDGATEILLESINDWDEQKIGEFVQDIYPDANVPEQYLKILKPITERIQYTVGNSKTEGDHAIVDVSITAVDAKSTLNSALAGAAAYAALKQATGSDSDPTELLTEYLTEKVDWDKATTIRTDATLYLVKGADEEWKVDLNDTRNMDVVNALSGGAVDLANDLQSLLSNLQ